MWRSGGGDAAAFLRIRDETMTIAQFAVCGFMFWPVAEILFVLFRHETTSLMSMLTGGLVTGVVGAVLGALWSL